MTAHADDDRDDDPVFLAAAGALASGVTADLRTALRDIRDSLAVLVETLDRHFGTASGPVPYPWAATQALRERLAEMYLLSRSVARTASDLSRAVAVRRGAPESVDLNKLVEESISLARPRIGEERELSVDAGDLPPVRLVPGEMMLLLATLIGQAASQPAAAAVGAAPIAVRTWRERVGDADVVVIQVGGLAAAPAADVPVARRVLQAAGGALTAAAAPDGGAAVEIRIPVPR